MSELTKLRTLAFAFFGVFLFAYLFAFRATFEAADLKSSLEAECAMLREKTADAKSMSGSGFSFQAEPSVSHVQSSLMSSLTRAEGQFGVQVESMEEPRLMSVRGNTVLDYSFSLSGSFQEQLQCIHLLETSLSTTYVQSIKLELRMNRVTRRQELIGTIYCKSILV